MTKSYVYNLLDNEYISSRRQYGPVMVTQDHLMLFKIYVLNQLQFYKKPFFEKVFLYASFKQDHKKIHDPLEI